MKKLLSILLVTVFSVSLFSSCKKEETDATTDKSWVKVVHASYDAPAVDVYVDNAKALSSVPFFTASDYLQVNAGTRALKITAAGATDAVLSANANVEKNKYYTVYALDSLASIEFLVTADDLTAPASGKAHIRVVHAAAAPAVDVAAVDGSGNVAAVLFSNLGTNAVTSNGAFTPVDAGTYKIGVRAAGEGNPILYSADLTVESGKIYTVVATGRLAGTPSFGYKVIVNK